jgi:hypothetical protein
MGHVRTSGLEKREPDDEKDRAAAPGLQELQERTFEKPGRRRTGAYESWTVPRSEPRTVVASPRSHRRRMAIAATRPDRRYPPTDESEAGMSDSQLTSIGRLDERLKSLQVRL